MSGNVKLIQNLDILRVSDGKQNRIDDALACEISLNLQLNSRHLVGLQCSPSSIKELAVGFLLSEKLLASVSHISQFEYDPENETVVVNADIDPDRLERFHKQLTIGSGCGRGMSGGEIDPLDCTRKVDTSFRVFGDIVLNLMKKFIRASEVFRITGGVHSGALVCGEEILFLAEDIGRHNALDKVVGWAALSGMGLEDKFALISGRLSLEVVSKSIRSGFPMIVSRGAPTDRAVELARSANLTLVGFARGARMNIYSAAWRMGL